MPIEIITTYEPIEFIKFAEISDSLWRVKAYICSLAWLEPDVRYDCIYESSFVKESHIAIELEVFETPETNRFAELIIVSRNSWVSILTD